MFKKTLIYTLFFISFNTLVFSDTPELLIKPNYDQYTRLSSGLSGTNITIIDSNDLKANQNENLPQILENYSGIEFRRLYGGVDGTNSSIDMRGFGEASKSNSLILINGIRLNDIDMSNVNFANIPIESIERIEIIRGNAGGTLYGSGAVGGTVNIVTKNEIPNNKIGFSLGSYDRHKSNFSFGTKINNNSSINLSGSVLRSDTYRDAAEFSNENIVLNYQNKIEDLVFNIDIFSSSRDQDLPGPRVKGGAVYNYHYCNRYEDSKTAKHIGGNYDTNGNNCNTTQRDDYSNYENNRINASIEYKLDVESKLYLNLGYKKKQDKAFLAANQNTTDTPNNGDRYLNTEIDGNLFNFRYENRSPRSDYSNVFTVGADHGHSFYNSKRHRKETERVGHIYYADLKSQALYFQNTTLLNEASLSISFGARYEITDFGGNNTVDRNVLGFVNTWDSTELAMYSKQTSNDAFNLGFEKEINKFASIYGNYAESFRVPNIDERIKATTSGSFELKDQTSDSFDVGFILSNTNYNLNASYYQIKTLNEIQYNQSVNTNLDPIEREGVDLMFEYQIDNKQKVMASFNYVNAEFTSGTLTPGTGGDDFCFYDNTTYCSNSSTWKNLMGGGTTYDLTGKKVPLVSPISYSINYANEIIDNTSLNIIMKYSDEKYVSNDQENIEPKIPDYYLVDTYLSSKAENSIFTVGINNLFNKKIYDFAVSSTFHDDNHYGLQNVYPLPDRNVFIDYTYTF